MAKRRGMEVLLILILVSLVSLWTLRDPVEDVSKLSSSPSPSDLSRKITINGISLGMTLDEVTDRLGPSLSEVNGKLIGDIYNFGREQGAMGFADFTGIQLGKDERVSFIQGGRLELDGKRVIEDFWSLDENQRAETEQKLRELLPEAQFQVGTKGVRKIELARERLVVTLGQNDSWIFRLGERRK